MRHAQDGFKSPVFFFWSLFALCLSTACEERLGGRGQAETAGSSASYLGSKLKAEPSKAPHPAFAVPRPTPVSSRPPPNDGADLKQKSPDKNEGAAPVEMETEIPSSAADELSADDPARIRRFSAAGTLRGQVQKISGGVISVGGANGKAQTLRGTPFTLGRINRGDDVEVPYEWVGNRRWLKSTLTERPPLAAFAVRGELRGPVNHLDRKRGILGIGKIRLRAHPKDLQSIAIGQILRVDFVEVDARLWVHSAEPAWRDE